MQGNVPAYIMYILEAIPILEAVKLFLKYLASLKVIRMIFGKFSSESLGKTASLGP